MGQFLLMLLVAAFSSLFIFLLFVIGYKSSSKKGFKRSLYRTTYLVLVLGVTFLLTKPLTSLILHFDLRKIGWEINVNGSTFNMLIDVLENFIIYNDFFNQLYEFFPSLRALFTEVPHLLVTPFAFVIIFAFVGFIFYPFYLLASFEDEKTASITRKEKNKTAGIIGGLQAIFLFSMILVPINGFNRAYNYSMENTLTEHGSICEQLEALKPHENVCRMIDLYNATIFAKFGGEYSLDQAIFRGVTSTNFGNTTTNIEKEISLIVRSSLILEQSGIIHYLNSYNGTRSIDTINTKILNDENIDLIIESVSESKYTNSIIQDLVFFLVETLNESLQDAVGDEFEPIVVHIDPEDLHAEVRVMFEALALAAEINILELMSVDLKKFDLIEFVQDYNPEDVIHVFAKMLDSKIFANFLFPTINNILGSLGVELDLRSNYDLKQDLDLFLDVMLLVKKYKTQDFFHIFSNLDYNDRDLIVSVLNRVTTSELFVDSMDILFESMDTGIDLPIKAIAAIKDWDNEIDLLLHAMDLYNDHQAGKKVEFSQLVSIIKSTKNSELAGPIVRVLIKEGILTITDSFYLFLYDIGIRGD